MNREILFRGQCCTDGKWVEGYLGIEVPDELVIQQFSYDEYFKSDCIDQYSVKPETIGQYTGLIDKNGVKIFEGDIVSGHLDDLFPEDESKYKVVWDDYGWHIKNSTGMDTFEKNWAKQYFEVIGNIHDNPELLKGSIENE